MGQIIPCPGCANEGRTKDLTLVIICPLHGVWALPSGSFDRGWIAVENQLPPMHQSVLVFAPQFVRATVGYAFEMYGQLTWHNTILGRNFDGATHWQPMPVPPRREEDADAAAG